jgi:hypothetical protein
MVDAATDVSSARLNRQRATVLHGMIGAPFKRMPQTADLVRTHSDK